MFNNIAARNKWKGMLFHVWQSLGGLTQIDDTYTIRRRFTIAEVNAGTSLLPALAEGKYRLIDAKVISVGGAVEATTTVDILGTQAGAVVKLLAIAIVALTQNTVVRDGATNAVVLAAGASYVVCDRNTGITVSKTGATATTATHVDVIIQFAVDEP